MVLGMAMDCALPSPISFALGSPNQVLRSMRRMHRSERSRLSVVCSHPLDDSSTTASPMNRPARNVSVVSLLLVILVGLGLIYRYLVPGPHAFSRALAAAVADGRSTIRLGQLPNPDWDRVYLFGPFTSEATIRSTLEFEWSGSVIRRLERSDSFQLLLFVRGQSVVMAVLHPRQQGDFDPSSLGRAIPRSMADFEVVRDRKDGWIVLRPRPFP